MLFTRLGAVTPGSAVGIAVFRRGCGVLLVPSVEHRGELHALDGPAGVEADLGRLLAVVGDVLPSGEGCHE